MMPADRVASLARPPRYVTPLRYPGGKAKLAKFVKLLLEKNDLVGTTYVEPYAGGASVALALLLQGTVSLVHINDLDRSVHAFWHCVLHRTEELCRLIRNRPVSVDEWRRQFAIQRNPKNHSRLELAFSTFYLNRTNRSGIICSGGMIGGKSQCGQWTLGARFNKPELVARIERIAAQSRRICLHRKDAAELLESTLPELPVSTFLYLDPPYYVKGKRRLYANFYEHSDHAKIASYVCSSTRYWLVSYDNQPEIRKLYRGFRHRNYRLTYTARSRYDGTEVLFFSPKLKIPKVPEAF